MKISRWNWARFSQRWIHGKTEQGFIEDKFRSFNAPFSIGAEWIYQQAREYGFNAAQVDFSPVEEIVSDAEKNLAPIEYSEMALKWRVVKQHRQNFRYAGMWKILVLGYARWRLATGSDTIRGG